MEPIRLKDIKKNLTNEKRAELLREICSVLTKDAESFVAGNGETTCDFHIIIDEDGAKVMATSCFKVG